jgi:hypothetical protein
VRTGDANTCAAYCYICVRPATTIYVSPYCQYAAGPSRPESLLSAPIKALFRLNEGKALAALSRLYKGSIHARFRLYCGSITALLRLMQCRRVPCGCSLAHAVHLPNVDIQPVCHQILRHFLQPRGVSGGLGGGGGGGGGGRGGGRCRIGWGSGCGSGSGAPVCCEETGDVVFVGREDSRDSVVAPVYI